MGYIVRFSRNIVVAALPLLALTLFGGLSGTGTALATSLIHRPPAFPKIGPAPAPPTVKLKKKKIDKNRKKRVRAKSGREGLLHELVSPIRPPGVGRDKVPLPDRPLTDAGPKRAGVGDVARITLGYSEPPERDKDKVSEGCDERGSLKGGVECVTTLMDGPIVLWRGSGGDGYSDATLDLRVRPIIEALLGSRFYRITLEVSAPRIVMPDDLKPESRSLAFADVARVMSRLRRWRKTTTEAEAKRLKLEKTATVGLRSPFRELQILRLAAPVKLRIRLGPKTDPDVRIRFVRAEEGEFKPVKGKLAFGQMFFVEARFKEDIDENVRMVRLSFDDLPGPRVAVKRTVKDRKLYRSKGFHLMDGYANAP